MTEGIAHNKPPDTSLMGPDELKLYLLAEFRNLRLKTNEITGAASDPKRVKCDSETQAEKLATFIKQINVTEGKADDLRKVIRGPYVECASMVQVCVKELTTDLDDAKTTALKGLTKFMLDNKIDKIKSDYGQTAFLLKSYKVEVTNLLNVPTEFLKIDEAAVKRAYKKEPNKMISGIKITELCQASVK